MSSIGRRISIRRKSKGDHACTTFSQASIIKYNPVTDDHVIKYDKDGKEEIVQLGRRDFKWICQPSKEAKNAQLSIEREMRNEKARERALIGRRFEYTTRKGKQKIYTIQDFNWEDGKHKVYCETSKKIKYVYMKELESKFRWIDVIAIIPGAKHRETTLYASKYIGVKLPHKREGHWVAFAPETRGGKRGKYIGLFTSEKDAALAHDCYARKIGCDLLNFHYETINDAELEQKRKSSEGTSPHVTGKCQYRGVHWQKNRKRWMARYSRNQKGVKHINLGAFLDPKHAALAFDHEARKQGRGVEALNFPDITVTDEQIEVWSTNKDQYRRMRSGKEKTSQFRGVTNPQRDYPMSFPWTVKVNISKVKKGLGLSVSAPLHIGDFDNELQAAFVFDRVCRKYGVKEIELNFPRNVPLPEVRKFDSSCHLCQKEVATDPVATSCNHVFCRSCIVNYLTEVEGCPCCQTPMTAGDHSIRSVQLKRWNNPGNLNALFKGIYRGAAAIFMDDVLLISESGEEEELFGHTGKSNCETSSDQRRSKGNENIGMAAWDYSTRLGSSSTNELNSNKKERSIVKTKSIPTSISDLALPFHEQVSEDEVKKKKKRVHSGISDFSTLNDLKRKKKKANANENSALGLEVRSDDKKNVYKTSISLLSTPIEKSKKRKKRKVNKSPSIAKDSKEVGLSINEQTSQKRPQKKVNRIFISDLENQINEQGGNREPKGKKESVTDLSKLNEGDRIAYDFGLDIYFGTIEKCHTGKKCSWLVEFDDGERYELDEKEMLEGIRIYEKMKEKELSDPRREEKLRKVKEDFLSEKRAVLAKIPAEVKAEFNQVGFALWGSDFCPVLFLSPYDISPGVGRDEWLRKFDKYHIDNFPRLVYWYGSKTLEEAYGVIEGDKCFSLNQGRKMNIKEKVYRKRGGRNNYSLMKEALKKPEHERLPFPKNREDYELLLGPNPERYLFELEAESRQQNQDD